jgi:hypothetical protein
MAKNKNDSSTERTRTPGSAEGERDPSDQNDRADEKVTGRSDEDDEFEDDDDESDMDEDEA